jgi:hypothetical protein
MQLLEEAAEAGANQVLAPYHIESDILDLVNDICDTDFTVDDAIGRTIIQTYRLAEAQAIMKESTRNVDSTHYRIVQRALRQITVYPYYQDVVQYYADVEPRY